MGVAQKNHVLQRGSLSKIFWYIWGTNGAQNNCKIKTNFFLQKCINGPGLIRVNNKNIVNITFVFFAFVISKLLLQNIYIIVIMREILTVLILSICFFCSNSF